MSWRSFAQSRSTRRRYPSDERWVEVLEARLLLNAVPDVAVAAPADAFIGEDFQLDVTVANNDATETGFAPFIDLIVPTTGADGDDGLTINGATYLGEPVTMTQVVFDALGEAVHPVLVDTAGAPVVLMGTPGDTLVVFQLPFGSFSPGQTAPIQISGSVSDLADEGVPLTLQTRAGYAFGCDPLDNPNVDDPNATLSPFQSTDITPTVVSLDKQTLSPEGEISTGPNFPFQYEVVLDLADGQQLTDVDFTDLMPEGLAFLSLDSVVGAPFTVVSLPPVGVPHDDAIHADVAINFASITGTASNTDVVITFSVFVPEFDQNGAPILDPAGGGDVGFLNQADVAGDWDPVDPRDLPTRVTDDDVSSVSAQSISVQKTSQIIQDNDAPGISTGDLLQFTVNVQVSDFFVFGDVILDDTLSDGLRFEGTPTLSVMDPDGNLTNVAFPGGTFSSMVNVDSTESLQFDISAAMAANGLDDLLQGGLADGLPNDGQTTVQLVYTARVQDTYDGNTGTQQPPVGQGDRIGNDALISGTVRDRADTNLVTGTESDDTGVSLRLPTGVVSKQFYAINGVVGAPSELQAGDLVTFRIQYALPLSDYEDLLLQDFLPQPVFDAATVTTFDPTISAVPPVAGTAQYGPADTFSLIAGAPAPVILPPTGSNDFTLDFGTFDSNVSTATLIDILFTVRVEDEEFADGLILANQVVATEMNTTSESSTSAAIANFTLTAPALRLTKGVVATTNAAGVFTPGAVGPVAFNAPGTAGPRFAGTVNSTNLAGSPIDSNLSEVDAGDLVTFAIMVENTGMGTQGAFDVLIQDVLQPDFLIPAGGLNLRVSDGAGDALSLDGGFVDTDLFGGGIRIADPGPTMTPTSDGGAIDGFDPTDGRNVLVITYDLEVQSSANPADVITNTATIGGFAFLEGGTDRADPADPDQTDDATVTVSNPGLDKIVFSSSRPDTGDAELTPGIEDLAIGEEVTFQITITVPEGEADLVLTDLLPTNPPGLLTLVSSEIVSVGANLTIGSGLGPTDPPNLGALGYDFGTVVNAADNIESGNDQIVVSVTAIVPNDPANAHGDLLTNTAVLDFNNGGQVSDTAQVEIVEPRLNVTKTPTPTTVDAGDTVDYEIVVEHLADSGLDAFDLVIEDLLADPALTLVNGSVTITTGPGGEVITERPAPGLEGFQVTLPFLAQGDQVVIAYQALVGNAVLPDQVVPNTADLLWDQVAGTGDPNERPATDTDTAQVVVDAPDLDKVIVATSRADTGDGEHTPGIEDLAIGEQVTFEITVTLPEGIVPFDWSDTLPAELAFAGAQIVFVGANVDLELGGFGAGAGTILAGPVFVPPTTGNAVNQVDNVDDVDDQVRFQVTATLTDASGAANADLLTNTSTLDYGLGTISDTAQVEVVEPELQIVKSVLPAAADAGDTVTYTLDISHLGTSTLDAFDIVIEDLLADARLTLADGTVTILAGPGGEVITERPGPGAEGFRVDVPVLALGQTLRIEYQAVVQNGAGAGDVIPNVADADWDNIPGAGDPNERAAMDSDGATVSVPAPGFDKSVGATSNPDTDAGDGLDPTIEALTIGETVFFDLTVTLPEGTTPVIVTDDLPQSGVVATGNGELAYVGFVILSQGANITIPGGFPTETVSDRDADGVDDRVVLDFGSVVNAPDGIVSADDTFIIRVEAVVNDVAENADGTTLTNNAELDFGGAAPITDSERVEIIEPLLEIDKIAPAGDVSATAPIPYELVVQHQGGSTAPAYDLVIRDALGSAFLTLVPGSVMVTVGPGGETVIENPGALGGFVVQVPTLDVGQVVRISYLADLDTSAPAGGTIPNLATLAWDSTPGPGGRPGLEDDMEQVMVEAPGVDKIIVDTSVPETGSGQGDPAIPDVVIGEIITYDLVITLPEATTPTLLVDDLPNGVPAGTGKLELLSANVFFVGGQLIGPDLATPMVTIADRNGDGIDDQVTFDFGDVTNLADGMTDADDTIVVRTTARVVDVPENPGGLQLTNVLDFGLGTSTDSETVEIVEPELEIVKGSSVVADGFVDYTLTVQHAPTSTAPGFDTVITDLLADPNLQLVAGTVTTNQGAVVTGNGAGDTTIVVDVGTYLLGSPPIVITYRAETQGLSPADLVVPNTGAVDFDSLPGPGGRPGQATDMEQVIVAIPTLDKTTTATSVPETGTMQGDPALEDLVVGEIATFTLTATFPQGDSIAMLTDSLPDFLSVVSSSVVSLGGLTLAGGAITAVGDAGVASDTNADGFDDRLVFDFGTVTNATGAAVDAQDEIVIEVQARVEDLPANASGALLTNTTTLVFDNPRGSGSVSDDAQVEIVEPQLEVVKSASPGTVERGDIVRYQLVVSHTGASTAAAFDVSITDLLASPNLRLVPGSVTTSLGVIVLGNGASDTSIQVDVPTVLLEPAPETVVITYQAEVVGTLRPSQDLPNTASAGFDSLPGPGGRPGSGTDTAVVTTPPPRPVPAPVGPSGPVPEGFSFNVFNDFGASDNGRIGDVFRFFDRFPRPEPPLLPIDPQYSGTAEPGTGITLSVFGTQGALQGTRSTIADAGGNWQVILPSASLERENGDEFFERLRDSELFQRNRDVFRSPTLLGFSPYSEPAVQGTVLADTPHSVSVVETRPVFDAADESAPNQRTYFTPPINHSHYVSQPPTPQDVMADRASYALDQRFGSAREPIAAGWNKFNHEFLAASGTPQGD